ncbi:ABC-2 transporter permease [Schleiferilactobacillus shenzhenensis]|uniref:ABC-2 transporter permease n=1 Tax=Schleiferilactobacillus shenzhenensis LY-73 TaxID=1231336 RepID=U4TQD2_9LACO|nr:ABC-2 transporter permease [Schleiferilactobacillus shenzhenensis]ERL64113.1 hypothetical protein L248_1555 [Schleiferilactobacillus shenzhenensis LY-73]
MHNAIKMMVLDCRAASNRNSIVYLFLVIDVLAVILFLTPVGDDSLFISFGALLGGTAMTLIVPFMAAAQRGLDALYALLPLRRRDIVNGHYLFGGLVAVSMGLNVMLLVGIMLLLQPSILTPEWLSRVIRFALMSPAMLLMMAAVEYPLLLRFGFDRAPQLVLLPLIGAGVGTGYLVSTGLQGIDLVSPQGVLAGTIVAVVVIAVFVVSLLLGRRLYERRSL